MARLPFVAKVLLALTGATLIVFLTPIPLSHELMRSLAADQAAPAPKAPAVVEAVQAQVEAKNENTLSQSPIRLERPEVLSNGAIKNGNSYFVLSDVTRFTRKDVCAHSSGQKWACGLQAYATLHNMIAGQPIDCIPRQVEGRNTVASCRLGSLNLAAQLLKNGLVKLQPNVSDLELQDAQNYAKSRHLGVWQ
jgi:hypothetical protein